MRRGISRTAPPPGTDEFSVPAPLRRWFFARKPDAGFVLTDFPATLLQAQVFDEWLEVRGESLDAALAGPGAPAAVVAHYRGLGLIADAASPFTLPLTPEGAAGNPRSA